MNPLPSNEIRLGLPKGRMQEEIFRLLTDAGIRLSSGSRAYRPKLSLDGFEAKILKPQNIVEMLHHGSRDIGFAGRDWVEELEVELIQLLDTGLDPVRVVAAVPVEVAKNFLTAREPFVVTSEYERLTQAWLCRRGLSATFVRSYGATEVFPPEDADCIVDNTATGATLRANGLEIIDEVLVSSTRLYANPRVMDDPTRRTRIEGFVLLLQSVLDARGRVMLEANVCAEHLEIVAAALPCLREPTISQLHGDAGYAVRAAVPRSALPTLVPQLKARGATDVVITAVTHLLP